MSYRVDISRQAEKQMRNLSQPNRSRIRERIKALAQDPYVNSTKLKSLPGFRQRTGDYRITYEINDVKRTVLVTRIAHRREAYR